MAEPKEFIFNCPYCKGTLRVVGVAKPEVLPPEIVTVEVVRRELGQYSKYLDIATGNNQITITPLTEFDKPCFKEITGIVEKLGGRYLMGIRVWVV